MTTLVLGIGNLLMGDEAVGVHVARRLEEVRSAPFDLAQGVPSDSRGAEDGDIDWSGVTVIDGGTGGFHLLSCLTDYDPVIVVDATMDGRPAGTVGVTTPKYASDFPRTLTAHDIGLRDLVESAALVHGLPRMFLVTVSIDAIQPMETGLTPPVASAIPEAVAAVRRLLCASISAD
ncbi:MAG: hydrogenase maturation protease [Bacteroidales bacterium]